MEGRDIGTVVFPDADIKFFLVASIEERTKRRAKEFINKGENISIEQIEENLKQRDEIDSTRESSPLVKANDAIEIDTTNLTIEEQVNLILIEIEKKFLLKN
jgi:cytidylate kinase